MLGLFLLVCGCKTASPESDYRRAWGLFAQAHFANATRAAADGASRYRADAEWRLRFQLLEAEIALTQGNYPRAFELLPAGAPPALEPRLAVVRAELAFRSGDQREAASLVRTARALSPEPLLATRLDIVEGHMLMTERKWDAAEQVLQNGRRRAAENKEPYYESSALVNLLVSSVRQSRFDEAVQRTDAVLATATRIGARRIMALAYTNGGVALYRLGEFDRAQASLKKAVELFEAIGDKSALPVAIGNSGNVYMLQGEPQRSFEPYQRAYEIARELKQSPAMALWSSNLASAKIETRNWDEAEKWNRIAGEHAKDSNSRLLVDINEAAIAYGRGRYSDAIRLHREALDRAGPNPGLQWELRSSLAQVYFATKRYREADAEFEAAFRSIEEARSRLHSDFKITLLARLVRFYQGYIDMLIDQRRYDKALEVAESSRARVLLERVAANGVKSASSAAISKIAAATNTFLLAFWIAPERSYAWLITPKGPLPPFPLPPAREIDSLVSSYRDNVENNPLAVKDDGARLWNALLGSIAAHIPAGSRVVVVPDGPLHRLNLETLRTPQGRYWLEDVTIAVAPSLSVLSAEPPRASSGKALLIGAPAAAGPDFPPLANAPAELANIKSLYTASSVYQGAQATPEVYRNAQPAQYPVIHFAAHAQANREVPLESAVILSRGPGGADQYKLYARDVVDIPIQADLVTISGCRSAGVRAYAGEGLIGFAWAFLRAGARHVVAGLWDVSDTSTTPLMTEFYKALASGQAPIGALHSAKLELLRGRYAKPYYWAPFQVYVRTLHPRAIAAR